MCAYPSGMDRDVLEALDRLAGAVARSVREWTRDDPGAAKVAAALGRWLIDIVGERDAQGGTAPQATPAPFQPPADGVGEAPFDSDPKPAAVPQAPVEFKPHRAMVSPRVIEQPSARVEPRPIVEPRPFGDVPTPDLRQVRDRARVKSRAFELALQMRQSAHRPGTAEEADRLREQAARLPGCDLRALDGSCDMVADDDLRAAASIFASLASMADLLHELAESDEDEAMFRAGFHLIAECQSSIWGLCNRMRLGRDRDQFDAFVWLRHKSWQLQEFIPSYLSQDSIADPDNHADLAARVEDFVERCRTERETRQERRRLRGKVRYVADKLRGGIADEDEALRQWTALHEAVEGLVGLGVRPSDVEIRESIIDLYDQWPELEGRWPGADRVLAEIERYLASRPDASLDPVGQKRPLSAQVLEVRQMLRGGRVVVIGGVCKPFAERALRQAFELSEVSWLSTREHQSIAPFEPEVARSETRLVIVAVRWSSHSFEGVKKMCERYDKSYLRLPGGYNPNQVAAAVLQQVSARLERASGVP